MKRYALFLVLSVLAAPALADTYQVTFGWTDPTTYLPGEIPVYEARYRIAGGTATVIPALPTPGGNFSATANPGQTIEVALRACNGTLCGPWAAYITATAQHPPTTPMTPTGGVITVVRTGP